MPPNRRGVGMVFQNYALFPNMTARQNIGFGLKVAGGNARGDRERGWARCSTSSTWRSSAPAIPTRCPGASSSAWPLPGPWPCSRGSSPGRASFRAGREDPGPAARRDPRHPADRLGITTIYVTHDQEEALSISDRIVVMRDGSDRAGGHALRDLQPPATAFVASFIGSTQRPGLATVVRPSARRPLVWTDRKIDGRPGADPRRTPGRLRRASLGPSSGVITTAAMSFQAEQSHLALHVVGCRSFLGPIRAAGAVRTGATRLSWIRSTIPPPRRCLLWAPR